MSERVVYITKRTANRLVRHSEEMRDIAERFRIVGSRGRAQTAEELADALRKMGNDLREEIRTKGVYTLRKE